MKNEYNLVGPGCKIAYFLYANCNREWISAYLFKKKTLLVYFTYIMWSWCLQLECHFGDILAYCVETWSEIYAQKV